MTEKDPSVYLTPDQPLVCSTKVSQSDVNKQEARVLETRKKLAEALAALTEEEDKEDREDMEEAWGAQFSCP